MTVGKRSPGPTQITGLGSQQDLLKSVVELSKLHADVLILDEEAATATARLNALLARQFAKWQLPDRYDFIAEIPRTSTGKFWKAKLRERYNERSGSPTAGR